MALRDAILDYTGYNHWANESLTNWFKSLDVKLLYQQTKSSFPSVDLTLQHMRNAQNFWYAVLTGSDIDAMDEKPRKNAVDWVIGEVLKGSQNLVNFVDAASEDDLMTLVTSPAITRTRHEFLLHVVNHNSYHRGQVITILRSLGATENIPNTDYDTYLWTTSSNPKA